jgi:hypothetical protein
MSERLPWHEAESKDPNSGNWYRPDPDGWCDGGQLTQAIQKGEIWEGPDRLRIEARAVILPMDEMTMTVNRSANLATRIELKTQYEGSPVAIAIDYETLPGGPSMMMQMIVQIPNEDVVVRVDSFDFVRLAGSNVVSL